MTTTTWTYYNLKFSNVFLFRICHHVNQHQQSRTKFNVPIKYKCNVFTTPPRQRKNASNADVDIKSMLQVVVSAAVFNIWFKNPCSYQIKAISSLLEISCKGQKASPFLLIQGTGSNQSTVP